MEELKPVDTNTASLPKNGQSHATLLSSYSTLFWRVFIPVFGTVFVSGLLLAFWLTDEEELYLPFPLLWVRLGLLMLWLLWFLLVRRTIWRLKRVDADDTHLYVTNYWTTVRYPWQDVARLEEKKRAGRRIVTFVLKSSGRFGQKISFLPGSSYNTWMEEHGKKAFLSAN